MMEHERGWLADEIRRTNEIVEAMPNGRALVREAAMVSEDENRMEAAAYREQLGSSKDQRNF